MFTIEDLLSYFLRCTHHIEIKDRQKIFDELSSNLEYWGRILKVRIKEEFKKAGIL